MFGAYIEPPPPNCPISRRALFPYRLRARSRLLLAFDICSNTHTKVRMQFCGAASCSARNNSHLFILPLHIHMKTDLTHNTFDYDELSEQSMRMIYAQVYTALIARLNSHTCLIFAEKRTRLMELKSMLVYVRGEKHKPFDKSAGKQKTAGAISASTVVIGRDQHGPSGSLGMPRSLHPFAYAMDRPSTSRGGRPRARFLGRNSLESFASCAVLLFDIGL